MAPCPSSTIELRPSDLKLLPPLHARWQRIRGVFDGDKLQITGLKLSLDSEIKATHLFGEKRRVAHASAHQNKKMRQNLEFTGISLAENRGFEPLRACTQHAFQACAIGH